MIARKAEAAHRLPVAFVQRTAPEVVKNLPGGRVAPEWSLGDWVGPFLFAMPCHAMLCHGTVAGRGCWGGCSSWLLLQRSPFPTCTVTGSVQVSSTGLNQKCINQKCSGATRGSQRLPETGFSGCPRGRVLFLYTPQGTGSGS